MTSSTKWGISGAWSQKLKVSFLFISSNLIFKDVNHVLKCSLEDYYNGKNVKLKIQRNQCCPLCHGRKALSVSNTRINKASILISQKPTQLCTTCLGKGTIRTPNELQFKLPVGCRNGYRKRLKGEGDCPANQIPSDIYLCCEQKKHNIYTRVGNVSEIIQVHK